MHKANRREHGYLPWTSVISGITYVFDTGWQLWIYLRPFMSLKDYLGTSNNSPCKNRAADQMVMRPAPGKIEKHCHQLAARAGFLQSVAACLTVRLQLSATRHSTRNINVFSM